MPKLIAKKNSSTKDIGKLNSNCYKGKKNFFNEWPKEACRCRLKNLFSKIIDFLKHFFTHFTFMRKTKKNCIINFSHKNFSLENRFFSFFYTTDSNRLCSTNIISSAMAYTLWQNNNVFVFSFEDDAKCIRFIIYKHSSENKSSMCNQKYIDI